MTTIGAFRRHIAEWVRVSLLVLMSGLLVACAASKPYRTELMPTPAIYESGVIDPFQSLKKQDNRIAMLYATDRRPAAENDPEPFYLNQRGGLLRLGEATVRLGEQDQKWTEVARISMTPRRSRAFPLQVVDAHELGVLYDSYSVFDPPHVLARRSREPEKKYAAAINAKLRQSRLKDIYIYVHGFRVNFENPVLRASEYWHFMGFEGVFIAYAWPSTPSLWAYLSDAETAVASARNLRLFLRFLRLNTEARHIHILGYSTGTRLVIEALKEITLIHAFSDEDQIRRQSPLGQVMLVGSDIDVSIFGRLLLDGLLKIISNLSLYMSDLDDALKFSAWVYDRERLGQINSPAQMDEHVGEILRKLDKLDLIDVTHAPDITAGDGHSYFRTSPWISSDIMVSLLYGLSPSERGLLRPPQQPFWMFPEDYVEQLEAHLTKLMKTPADD
jgi:esterase/lipase superfamily enzyme